MAELGNSTNEEGRITRYTVLCTWITNVSNLTRQACLKGYFVLLRLKGDFYLFHLAIVGIIYEGEELGKKQLAFHMHEESTGAFESHVQQVASFKVPTVDIQADQHKHLHRSLVHVCIQAELQEITNTIEAMPPTADLVLFLLEQCKEKVSALKLHFTQISQQLSISL